MSRRTRLTPGPCMISEYCCTQAIYRRLARDGPIDADGTARALRAVILELRDRYPHEIWAAYLHAGV